MNTGHGLVLWPGVLSWMIMACAEADQSDAGINNAGDATEIRAMLTQASDIQSMRAAVHVALASAQFAQWPAVVDAIAQEELKGSRVAISDLYAALKASAFRLRLDSGREFSTEEFVEALQHTLAAAHKAGPENLGWEIALGGSSAEDLSVATKLRPTEAALVALSWAAAANRLDVAKADVSIPGKAALGVISASVGAALWWGAAVVVGGTSVAVAIISAPAVLAVAAGIAIGMGAIMVGAALIEGTTAIGEVVAGTTESGDLVTGKAVEEVKAKISQDSRRIWCTGYWAPDALGGYGCWFVSAAGQSCSKACEEHSLVCVPANWNDDATCSVCRYLHGSDAPCVESSPGSPGIPVFDNGVCVYRELGGTQTCDYRHNISNIPRLCVCDYR